MILALRALGIGDLATGVPALRGLRRARPDDELVLGAPAWLAPLVPLIGGVDRLIDVPDLSWPPLPLRPALAVNLHGCGPQSHRLLLATEPGLLLAFGADGPQWRDHEHEVHRWCRMLRWYGIATDPTDLALSRPPANGVPTFATVVHVGAKAPERRWPPDRFATVVRALAAAGHRVVVTGNAAEREAALTVAAAAGLSRTDVLAGLLTLGQLAALVAHARLLISGDTGAGHLATAFGTPSVLLFGPTPPREWGPPPDRSRHRVLWAGPSPPGTPGAVHPALAELTAVEVLAAVSQLNPILEV